MTRKLNHILHRLSLDPRLPKQLGKLVTGYNTTWISHGVRPTLLSPVSLQGPKAPFIQWLGEVCGMRTEAEPYHAFSRCSLGWKWEECPSIRGRTLLCRFIAGLAKEGLAPSTLKTYLSGIRHAQIMRGLPVPVQAGLMGPPQTATGRGRT